MDTPILFVVNPISGDQDKSTLIDQIEQWCDQNGFVAQFFKTTGKEDAPAIKEKIDSTGVEKLVAVGGDGTIKLCGGILKDSKKQLGIIPAGSANGMAAELRIPENASEALNIIKNGAVKCIDLLEFNEEELGLHISDLGLNAGFIRRFDKSEYRGFLGYAQGLVGKVQDINEFEVEIKVDDGDFQTYSAFMIAIANAQRYGTGAILNTLGKIDDGLMEICIFKNLNIIQITRHFLEQITEDDDHFKVIQCTTASIKVKKDKKPFQIDGQYKGLKEEVNVKMLPQCLHVIVPH